MARRVRIPKKCNLMILGASGGVANAVLHYMRNYRGLFGKLVLVDKNRKVLNDKFLDHPFLDYTFVHRKIDLPAEKAAYLALLKKHAITVVLDLTDMDSIEILEASDEAGVSYVNTAMNDEEKTVKELVYDVYSRKRSFSGAPHVLCSGMNPGNVNMWVRHGIATFGRPKQIVHFNANGASKMRVRGPFMIEGAIYGIVATILTLILFWPVTAWLGRNITDFLGINMYDYYVSNFFQIFAIILLSGIFLGVISSFLAIRKYLNK